MRTFVVLNDNLILFIQNTQLLKNFIQERNTLALPDIMTPKHRQF